MSEFFLELFSEEIPAGLQKDLREKIFEDFKNLFEEKSIKSKKNFSFSFDVTSDKIAPTLVAAANNSAVFAEIILK